MLVRARTADSIRAICFGFNLSGEHPARFLVRSEMVNVVTDGSVQSYLIPIDADRSDGDWAEAGPWEQLGIWVYAGEPASLDILSVSVIPIEAQFADAPVGVRTVARGESYRRAQYVHAPAKLKYRVRVPEAGRLDVGLGVLRDDAPVTFTITLTPQGGAGTPLLQEVYANDERWAQRSIDLSNFAGQTVTLAFEADAERPGTVALWAAPTLSGAQVTDKPNIIFYIIDGAGAESPSVYGYNRRTTPYLERLAAEGAIFEHAYSNSSWTRPSTPSLTSLQHSVLGGLENSTNAPPPEVLTMAEHFHRAGYETAVFTSNTNAGRMSKLERGVDVFREAGVEPNAASSRELHEDFWRWREAYPAKPYWVRFQTTDVHYPHRPVAPFAGLFVSPDQRATYEEWARQLRAVGGDYPASRSTMASPYSASFQKAGISRLVERLKATGEWDQTLLIVASDHSIAAAAKNFHVGLMDPLPPRWDPMFRPSVTRIPLIVVWPERIAAGQHLSQP